MFKNLIRFAAYAILNLLALNLLNAQKLAFLVSMEQPSSHYFHITFRCDGIKGETIDFHLPVWTPGYYQRMDYAKNIENFHATNETGKEFRFIKNADNSWKIYNDNDPNVILKYDVKTSKQFVGSPYIDENRAYVLPAGIFLYPEGLIRHPIMVSIKPYANWQVTTGLDSVIGKRFTYTAPDFDILYDSPFLAGYLEELPSFKVKGVLHRFIGYKLGEFDRIQFMTDLKEIVETASDIIGDIPYKHYTFIAIGPGQGGIEHLNSTTISFSGSGFDIRENRIRTLHFIAHEYFHHYNVKRIRPIELGPFDYDKENRTKLLWVSEGLSVYYEYLIVKRASLSTEEELLNAFRSNIIAFQTKPGRLFQSLEQASYETWSDGPFGRTGDEMNKTISYYDKGPIVGLLLDFKIRHDTKNKKSLDDVMRTLYSVYYQNKKRGFTEREFQSVCEKITGGSLQEIFDYVSTIKEINYQKYFSYAGLEIDLAPKELPGVYSGLSVRQRNDSLFISAVDWESPSWKAGLRPRNVILEIDGQEAKGHVLDTVLNNKRSGDNLDLVVLQGSERKQINIELSKKIEPTFQIKRMTNPSAVQSAILDDWLGNK